MKSGLRDRNNPPGGVLAAVLGDVSMKSGLRDRNNAQELVLQNEGR